jgi:putative peptide zinc metalloprotease protein
MDNEELRLLRDETSAALRESRMEFAKALEKSQADCEPMEKRIGAYTQRLQRIDQQIADLTVTAPISGNWVAPDVDDYIGRWMPRGSRLGQLIDANQFYFVSAILQQEIAELFSQKQGRARVRLCGQAQEELPVVAYTTIPMEQHELPSAALGYMRGGDIAVSPNDSAGVRTTEPFYEVRAIVGNVPKALLLHGRSGKIRFSLGYKPLAWQGWRKIRQLVQKHYQI